MAEVTAAELSARPRAADPETRAVADPEAFVRRVGEDEARIHLMLGGVTCAGCVRKIERALKSTDGVLSARVNLSTQRLDLRFRPGPRRAQELVGVVTSLGYRAAPFDPAQIRQDAAREDRALLTALAVAGFGAANVMLLSISVWSGAGSEDMSAATRDFLHWISALIALPVVAFAGRSFYRSAFNAIRHGGMNMDVPISLAVILASGMSLAETLRGGEHVYFDASLTLLFFLLIGRYLDRRARGKARSVAEQLLLLDSQAAVIVGEDGSRTAVPVSEVRRGMTVAVHPGDRVPVDGTVLSGRSMIDTSLVSGETVPLGVAAGDTVYAGMVSLDGAITLRVTAADEDTLLAEIVRLAEAAEQGRARYVRLADRIARWYAPAVHIAALATFLGWWLLLGVEWQSALLVAVAVLIVTCPCALGLAVPVVQVVSSGRLLQRGILVKSADGLERLAQIDTVVFDKTGTLTLGKPELIVSQPSDDASLKLAARIAAGSRHPLSRALARAAGDVDVFDDVREHAGLGLSATVDGSEVRLGSRIWCGVADEDGDDWTGPELWLAVAGQGPVQFRFRDTPRTDAREVVTALRARGFAVELLSGDREGVAEAVAKAVGIETWRAAQSPADKVARLEALKKAGRTVLMVGDGLNDAPALAAAHASISPAAAADISQAAADFVFQGDHLAAVLEIIDVSRGSRRLVFQNFALSFLYNAIAMPLAMAGLVTPLIAAVAMSSSSLVVTLNALRMRVRRGLLAS